MARLNEPPAAPASIVAAVRPTATETLDARKSSLTSLHERIWCTMRTKSKIVRQKPPANYEEEKRRFLRQNRELAKHNSSQSLRIRTLELDVSRLLADNLELRNQVLRLQNEVYTAQSQSSTAAVQRIKIDLQAKIAELSGLVDGIEEVQKDDMRMMAVRKPLEGNWRERQPLSEIMRDSQMPTITEDKQYPRRTLNADEIRAIRLSDQSSNESPELGPPPIARFDYTDPVKSGSPLANKLLSQVSAVAEDNDPAAQLSINLETRRKRKDGQPKLEIRRHSILPQSPGNEGETPSILRTGAKRKMADRDTEKPIKPPSKGDFTFSRKVNIEETKAGDSEKAKVTARAEELGPEKSVRKVLGEKSVNESPRKAVPSDKQEKEDNKPPKDSNRRRRVSSIPLPSPGEAVVEIAPPATDLPPKTPAALDLFSPTPSEPSTLKEAGRGDTPPPGDLSTLSTTIDGGMRPSRRARSSVNYAEPSLISKMRRPDKKMVDAVTGLQDPRRAMSGSGKGAVVKTEPAEDDAERWKNSLADAVASSPLTQRSGGEELPLAPPSLSDKPSNSSATISALVAASRKRRESHNTPPPLGTDMDAATKKMEELDLYEFKESSSPLAESAALIAPRMKTHRRHSSVPKDVRVREVEGKGEGGQARAERAVGRRRSMQL